MFGVRGPMSGSVRQSDPAELLRNGMLIKVTLYTTHTC